MALQYFLDGYNIIKCRDELADGSLGQGRRMLLQFLSAERPQGSARNQVIVVFDGKEDVWGPTAPGIVKVIFTSGETADDYIKRAVDRSDNVKNVIVVTNDGELACFVRKLGAKVLNVDDFMGNARRRAKTMIRKKSGDAGILTDKNITKAVEGRINKEMEDIWINKGKQ